MSALLLLGLAAARFAWPPRIATHVCDVVIAGGSLASAAAAVAAGETSNLTRVCFIEITDWPGGVLYVDVVALSPDAEKHVDFVEGVAHGWYAKRWARELFGYTWLGLNESEAFLAEVMQSVRVAAAKKRAAEKRGYFQGILGKKQGFSGGHFKAHFGHCWGF